MSGTNGMIKGGPPGGIINGALTLTVTEGPHAGGTMTLTFRNYPLEAETVFDVTNSMIAIDLIPGE